VIGPPSGTQIWIAAGVTDMRRGVYGLAGLVETALQNKAYSGHVFVFRGRRGDLIKLLWADGVNAEGVFPTCGKVNFPRYPVFRSFVSCLAATQSAAAGGRSSSD